MTNDPRDQIAPEDWQATWEANRHRQLMAGMDATPAQRLQWLEEVIALAYQSGALPKGEEPSGQD